jgi:hypothetical protein
MNVLQCPKCEIRVWHASELRDHLTTDHPSFESRATSAEDDLLGACYCHHAEAPGSGRWLSRSGDAKNAA